MIDTTFQMPAVLNVDEETMTSRYGKFWAQPFERGWGTTIGNMMRRILLSSIEGAAFTHVKIHGALHEFSTVPGVTEDVTRILLNIKTIPIRMHSERPRILHVKKKGKGDLLSGDIEVDQDVEIIDPNIHIATLDDDGEIEMEFRLQMGRGYVPSENNIIDDLDIGFLPIDSVHSPVTKVNFQVFPARVGRISTYDRLVLEVWTNGTLLPIQTVEIAASLLGNHLEIFQTEPNVMKENDALAPQRNLTVVDAEVLDDDGMLTRSVEELEVPSRIINNLKKADINVIDDLVVMTRKQLLKTVNFGKKSVEQVESAMEELGIFFMSDEEVKTREQEDSDEA